MKLMLYALTVLVLAIHTAQADPLKLTLRCRTESTQTPGQFAATERPIEWDPHKTAVIICDMWDRHWCKSATARVAEMAPQMNKVISKLREQGVLIFHCPSDTMNFYKDHPGRKLAGTAPPAAAGKRRTPAVKEGPFPIDHSDGGCPDEPQCPQGGPWRRQIATLEIKDGDPITDNGDEAYNLMRQRGIENVIVMGVHTNMCVLGRSFAIQSMVNRDMNVALMRDLTDAMYNPRRPPRVDHFAGTDLVIEWIEKYWCPTIASDQILGGKPFRFAADKRSSAEQEKALQKKYPAYRGVDSDYRHAGPEALDRWMDWKWGLRIHWGLYCMVDGQESWIITNHLNDKEWQKKYYTMYQDFNPMGFNADEWMEIMKRAGMKYFSFTSKHHEGFCLWPTKTTQRGWKRIADGNYEEVVNNFSIMDTPCKKDIIGELVNAGRRHGLGVSLYYSHIDWHDWDFGWDRSNYWYDPKFTKQFDPKRWAAFIQKERDQIAELLTWYGPIDTLCLDMSWTDAAQEDAYGVARLARSLQTNIMLRNRGIGPYGDYETPEGTIPEDPTKVNRPWQVIYPCGTGFSYKKNDRYKSKEWVLESLIDIVAKGGNFQVGFGPDPNGKWPREMIERVSYVGDWLKINGESIYATRPWNRWHEGKDIRFTRSKDGKHVYAICLKWPGSSLKLATIKPRDGTKIAMLGVDEPLVWRMDDKEGLMIQIPEKLATEANRPCKQAYAFRIEGEPR